ncbi:MAG TPA: efflux RND transporter periplasmic adaptor subunit [Sandaracinaceae bacterium LLY-WYZ-13_1]|nr:efflux RND transporter periplasmic adaptor subunit [Sandaracinaceae bacterium LLY-WYZ-13_1]
MRRSIGLLALALAACGSAEEASIEPADEAAASAPTRWVGVARPADRGMLEAPAVARAAADASGEVAATVRVRVTRWHVQPGATVEAGDPVVDVAAPALVDAAAAHAGASRRLRVHAERADELEAARREGLVRSAEVFEQRSLVAELRAARDRAAATLRAAGLDPRRAGAIVRSGQVTLRAPVGGVVTAGTARPGEIREPGGDPLARVVGSGVARVEVRTSEPWPVGTPTFHATDGRVIPLASTPLATVVDPDDGTRVAWYSPSDGDTRLPNGLRGVARLAGPQDLWEVPVDAVDERAGRAVLVRRREGAEATVDVEVVSSSGATAWVRGEPAGALREGDRVAANLERHRAAAVDGDPNGGGEGNDTR